MREARELQTLIDQLEAYIREQDEAIKALQKTNEYLVAQLRQALAQPEQEPVCDKDPSLCGFTLCQLAKVCKHTPRNTIPIKIVGPNLEAILNAAGFYRCDAVCCGDYEKCIQSCTPRGRWLAEKESRKEWVSLTDDEIQECQKPGLSDDVYKLIEAKLRERNT